MQIETKVSQTAISQVGGKTDDIKNKAAEEEKKKLKKACADFESLFVYNMLKTMRQSIPQSGLTGNGAGKDIYEMMLDQKIAEEVTSKRGGIGLQKMLLEQMQRYQKSSGGADEK